MATAIRINQPNGYENRPEKKAYNVAINKTNKISSNGSRKINLLIIDKYR